MDDICTEFVNGWDWDVVLGNGTYGTVRLLVHRDSNEKAATKILNVTNNKNDVIREIRIHKLLDHENIVQYFGSRWEPDNTVYMFLQYCSGGELFDRITPDEGMDEKLARSYYKQLLDGVEYLHDRGFTHRDIKPENLLFDSNDTLKIIDFGLATIYRVNGRQRNMTRYVGTPQYMAPEIIQQRPHKAQPAEVFSCGIVLVAMLTGMLPWGQASLNAVEYHQWWDLRIHKTPWNKLNLCQLDLIKKILNHDPEQRYTITKIRKHRWVTQQHVQPKSDQEAHVATQPDSHSEIDYNFCEVRSHASSQPAKLDSLIISPNITPSSQGIGMSKNLVQRMTRFWMKKPVVEISEILVNAANQFKYNTKQMSKTDLRFQLDDKWKNEIVFTATIYPQSGDNFALIDFRLSRGDGIAFKRAFLKLRDLLACDIVVSPC